MPHMQRQLVAQPLRGLTCPRGRKSRILECQLQRQRRQVSYPNSFAKPVLSTKQAAESSRCYFDDPAAVLLSDIPQVALSQISHFG